MKKILVTLFLIPTLIYSQKKEKLEEYTASNGITYKVGDTFKLGQGSDTNGQFVYVNMGGWMASTDPQATRLPAANAGLILTVKKIKQYNSKRFKGVYFTVGGGNITNYVVDIENAIKTCEVEICNKETVSSYDKYDQLAKLKKLLDEGVLTKEEFESEKKKILRSN